VSRLTSMPKLSLDVSIKLSEPEIRALDAMAGYGADAFLQVFYEHMGRHYLEPHEKGLRSLFDTIMGELPPIMKRQDAARKAFALHDPVIRSRAEHDEMIARLKAIQAKEAP
jgi:hypothetical protein